ncbi:uncharacterized protein LOC121877280 [Homarus americanus]|uniref:uncharacterized protein LOC121877280 n=1 Tax=Homarus americanus TaxID=6706 RepID=UPI001C457A28|nr:uncharacterized protein LOC121877280 [Homarus americanus]
MPEPVEEWQKATQQLNTNWNFPMCFGAIDGERVSISKPPKSGSEYFDYKAQNSIAMLALVDADNRFMYINAGSCGRASDAGIWDRCTLKEGLEQKLLNVPTTGAPLPFSTEWPYVIVGDDAFPLKTYMMKPFPGEDLTADKRIFNYWLSRERRLSLNAFGILSAKFRIFK